MKKLQDQLCLKAEKDGFLLQLKLGFYSWSIWKPKSQKKIK